jgi:serine phosphatase RsbU (regulator of sigma subunit)
MTSPRLPKVAGIHSPIPPAAETAVSGPDGSGSLGTPSAAPPGTPSGAASGESAAGEGDAPGGPEGTPRLLRPFTQLAAVQDRLASWISDLTTLHDLVERLARTATLDDALAEVLRAGGALVGARRGLVALVPADGRGPERSAGLGLARADLGSYETVPPEPPGAGPEVLHADLLHEPGLPARHREVAERLGFAASYSLRLVSGTAGPMGSAVWFYDEPAQPEHRQRHLAGLYCRQAAEHLARLVELTRARDAAAALRDGLLPARLPRLPWARLAVRHRAGAGGGGDWFDALPLPEGALGLSVGGVAGAGAGAVAAMGRLRAGLRAYAVMEGEDPVAVLSDLELLLRLTEPALSATALFAYAERAEQGDGAAAGGASGGSPAGPGPYGASGAYGSPAAGGAGAARASGPTRVVLAGAGHCPPLLAAASAPRADFVETTLSAPLGMLSCWEAPGVELVARPGETLLLYTDGLLHRIGETMDRALARLHAAAASASRAARQDPEDFLDHVLATVLPDGLDTPASATDSEDVVLLAVRFD